MRVSESNRPTSDTSARRIAISAVDQMPRNSEIEGEAADIRCARAAFRERAIYELALRDKLSCDDLAEEIRIKEDFPHTYQDKYDGGKSKTAHCQPSHALKLSLEPGTYHEDCICDEMRELYATVRAELLKGETNERDEGSRVNESRRIRVAGNNKGGVADVMPREEIPVRSGDAQQSRISGKQRLGVVAASRAKPGSVNR